METQVINHVKATPQQLAAHEMFTPLAVIHAYTQLLQQQTFEPLTPQQQTAILKIAQSSHALKELFSAKIAEFEPLNL